MRKHELPKVNKDMIQVKACRRKAYYDEFGFSGTTTNWADAVWEFCYTFNLVYINGIYDDINPIVKDMILEIFKVNEEDLYK